MKLFSHKPKNKQTTAETPEGEVQSGARAIKSPRKSPGLNLLQVALISSLLAALAILGTGFFAYLKYDEQVTRQQQLKVAAAGERIAAHIAGRLDELTGMVEIIGRDPEIIRLALNDDVGGEQLAQRLAALSSFFPNVLRIRIVRPDETEPDTTTTPALSYACLDLVRQAESGGKPKVEVHKFSTPDQHIDLIGLVRSKSGIIGSLLVTLDVKVVNNWIKPLLPAGALIELRQKSGDLLLNSQGNQSLKGSALMHTASIAGSAWEISYWQQLNQGVTGDDRMGFIVLVIIAMLLTAIIVMVAGFVSDRLIRQDLVTLMTLVIEIVREREPRPVSVRMAEVRKAVIALEHAYRAKHGLPLGEDSESQFEKRNGAEQGVTPEAVKSEDDLPPEPSFTHSGGIIVEESEVTPRHGKEYDE